jgi:hypothetical protein
MNNAGSILPGPWMLEDEGNWLLRGIENRLLETQSHISEDWNPEQFLIIRVRDFQYSIPDLVCFTTSDFQNSIPPPALPLISQGVSRI